MAHFERSEKRSVVNQKFVMHPKIKNYGKTKTAFCMQSKQTSQPNC